MRIETTPAGLLVTLAEGDYSETWELDDWPGITLYVAAGRPVQMQMRAIYLDTLRQWIDAELGGRLDADTLARRYRLAGEGDA